MLEHLRLRVDRCRQAALAKIPGRVVLFAYPRTGVPGQISPVDGWDMIPGARGCTPQTCAFRDQHKEIIAAGAARVFGLSTQDSAYQRGCGTAASAFPAPLGREARVVEGAPASNNGGGRHDAHQASGVGDRRRDPHKGFYPVFPPDRNAGDVLTWLEQNPRR
jgi:hypothetical protein